MPQYLKANEKEELDLRNIFLIQCGNTFKIFKILSSKIHFPLSPKIYNDNLYTDT